MTLRFSSLTHVAAAAGFGLLATPALAGSISDAYDGRYQGSGQMLSHLSNQGCSRAPDDVSVRIDNGNIFGSAGNGARINAFVTTDGFFTGNYRFPDGTQTPIEGLLDGGALVGGIFRDGRCAYLVEMNKS